MASVSLLPLAGFKKQNTVSTASGCRDAHFQSKSHHYTGYNIWLDKKMSADMSLVIMYFRDFQPLVVQPLSTWLPM